MACVQSLPSQSELSKPLRGYGGVLLAGTTQIPWKSGKAPPVPVGTKHSESLDKLLIKCNVLG